MGHLSTQRHWTSRREKLAGCFVRKSNSRFNVHPGFFVGVALKTATMVANKLSLSPWALVSTHFEITLPPGGSSLSEGRVEAVRSRCRSRTDAEKKPSPLVPRDPPGGRVIFA